MILDAATDPEPEQREATYDRSVLVVSGAPQLDHHETGYGHPERKARVQAALDGIASARLWDAVVPIEPRRASIEELCLVHPLGYVEGIESICAEGGGALDSDTIVSEGSFDTACFATGACLAVVDSLASGRGHVGFAAARPPGHHAAKHHAMGFCLFNNVAIAAAYLVERGERVCVVDWDVHHGNGTQEIFWDEPRVLYVSTHQSPLYPGTGSADEIGGPGALGLTLNVPLPAHATGDVCRRAFDEIISPEVEAFEPDWVLVSAGFDAHRADPLANLELTSGDFAAFAKVVAEYTPAPGRLAFVLEGGYDLEALRVSVGATLAAALGEPVRAEAPSSGGPGADDLARVTNARLRAFDAAEAEHT
ncbi:MAG: histone deacetylase [Acidimicrobiales bacterium]